MTTIHWEKLGAVFHTATQGKPWMKNSALTPTPFRLDDRTIRVYAGFRDEAGVSRIGYVDVDAEDPRHVLHVADAPVLDIGRNGCFDDNGVILGDVVRGPRGVYMFYVGFQLVAKAKFLAFSGVALSTDGGHSFARLSESPILDRAAGQSTIGAIHTARFENGRWRLWYASGDDWEIIDGKPFPQYHIRYVEADDLLDVPRRGDLCVDVRGSEYRIGRPRVYVMGGEHVMYYTKGTREGDYFPGLARSPDGRRWTRHDDQLGIALSATGWDSQTLCYPALITVRNDTYMFYNGNNMGYDGFGCAKATGVTLDEIEPR
ncbi:hypothetical protein [Paraburkholderia kururiensis]|uniref:Uncharacterized protein n=1 Tax=Paraburkholderia kururiensis TaxID=984307 RepID=A0ABZ0WFQ2_9BURK|nr:hypothetical protein [Paraburkholderia kururiensis]WQD76182.1 hypothetical protein U0042_18940 [Paraburkholderia kururiensis]